MSKRKINKRIIEELKAWSTLLLCLASGLVFGGLFVLLFVMAAINYGG